MFKAKVYVTLRESILDPQGKAVTSGLHKLGFDEVENVRIGKYIEVTLNENSEERLKEMCDKLLANYVMEDYRFEIGEECENSQSEFSRQPIKNAATGGMELK